MAYSKSGFCRISGLALRPDIWWDICPKVWYPAEHLARYPISDLMAYSVASFCRISGLAQGRISGGNYVKSLVSGPAFAQISDIWLDGILSSRLLPDIWLSTKAGYLVGFMAKSLVSCKAFGQISDIWLDGILSSRLLPDIWLSTKAGSFVGWKLQIL